MLDLLVILLSQEILEESLDRKLDADLLTGLSNRMGIERALRQWSEAGPAERRQAAAALIDIDGFRQINERLGVRQANQLLESFGSLLAELAPQDGNLNRAARYAGQALALFFTNADPSEAASLVEQIREAVRAQPFHVAGQEVKLTISCAVVPIRENETTSSLFERLGETLAAVKTSGGNQTRREEEPSVADDSGLGNSALEIANFESNRE
jgi:diguanylate cyclase